jgi:hypothetical protein
MSRIRGAVVMVLALAAFGVGQDKPPEHPKTCPRDCPPCTKAVDQALRHLANMQNSDGGYHAGNAGPIVHTAMAGLAFLAAGNTDKKGKFRSELALCRDYILQELNGPNMNMVHWDIAYSAIFFAELHRAEPSNRVKDALRKLVSKIEIARHKNGGWSHGRGLVAQKMKSIKYSETLTVVTMFCLAGLALAKEAGVKVNPDVVDAAVKYLKDVSPHGAPTYSPEMPWATALQSSSRASAMMAFMPSLKGSDDAFVKDLRRHALNGFKSITFETADPHPYVNYWLAAVGLYRQGDEAWAKAARLRDQILSLQKNDGHWEPAKDIKPYYGGSVFFTASCAVILAIPLEHLPMTRR